MKQIATKAKAKRITSLSVRFNEENSEWLTELLKEANKNRNGRKVKPNDVITLLKSKVAASDLEALKKEPTDYEKQVAILRQKYIKEFGPTSKNAFLGFMMSAEFQTFLAAQRTAQIVAPTTSDQKAS